MFWKKKEATVKGVVYQCQVPGCGLDCSDEATLKRHTAWAHQAAAAPGKQAEAMKSQPQNTRA